MARGDIFTIDFPSPAGRPGHEQIGRRPGIVVQTNLTDASLSTTMIIPLTANLKALRFPHTIQVNPSPQNGLQMPSVLLVFQLRSIDKARLMSRIGCLENFYLDQVDKEMRRLLGL